MFNIDYAIMCFDFSCNNLYKMSSCRFFIFSIESYSKQYNKSDLTFITIFDIDMIFKYVYL